MPYRVRCAAIAARSSGRPGPGGYWLTPDAIASCAAASIDGGPSVSGKPCPRFTAPVRAASAVISAKIVEVNGSRRGTKAFRRTATQSHGQWSCAATDGPGEQRPHPR